MNDKPKFGFIVEYVKNIEEAKHFYNEVVGLQIQREHPTFVQFDNFAIASDEPIIKNNNREIYWVVDNAQAEFNNLEQKTEVTLPLKQMAFGKVFGIKGASGEPLYFVEFERKRPSEAI